MSETLGPLDKIWDQVNCLKSAIREERNQPGLTPQGELVAFCQEILMDICRACECKDEDTGEILHYRSVESPRAQVMKCLRWAQHKRRNCRFFGSKWSRKIDHDENFNRIYQ